MPIARTVFFLTLLPYLSLAQHPTASFDSTALTADAINGLRKEFGGQKNYPAAFEKQVLLALSYYPELKKTRIYFRVRAKHTPLATRSSWSGLLHSRHKRDYVITMSDSTEDMLRPLLFEHLPFNAQVGVIGHELGHVVDFSSMTTGKILSHGMKSISSKYVDRFEYRTDSICIAHGLGYQLLAWSTYVRHAMHRDNWDGADNVHKPMMRERYMNPSTIRERIARLDIYRHTT